MSQEYSILKRLPDNGQKCLAYGYKTFCCKEDMEKNPSWHNVTFNFSVSSYRIKKEFPLDIEESILEICNCIETWKVNDNEEPENHLIGVTKWMPLVSEEEEF